MPKGVRSALHALLLAAVFVGSTSLATHHPQAIGASTAWLPSGIAVAGLLVLGRRAAVVLLLAAVGQRLCIDYLPAVAAADALGVTVEGAVGAWLVRRLRPRLELGRLADLLAVFVAAALAPLSSIAVSWLARLAVEPQAAGNFASSWDSWWRMNAIGILLVVPLVLAWRGASARRQAPEAAVWALAAAALTAIVARFAGPGMPAILLLASVLVVAFLAALRLGPRGATATAFAGALAIALPTAQGAGPLLQVPFEQRHVVAQMLLVGLAALPAMFGVLLAERDANAARWLRSEGLGQALLRVLPDTTWRLRPDGTFVDPFAPPGAPGRSNAGPSNAGPSNAAPAEAGGARGALAGRRLQDLLPPGQGERLLRQLAGPGRAETVEFRAPGSEPAAEGAAGPREGELRFVRLPDGDVLVMARDITGRKRAEREITWQARVLEMIATAKPRQDVFAALVAGVEELISDCRCSVLLARAGRLHVAWAPSLPAEFNALVEGFEIRAGHGACGAAAHANETVVCVDLDTDPRFAPYRAVVARFGLRACWSVPMRSADGAVLGTFAIYHGRPRTPEPAEIRLVERAATLAGLAVDRERREGLLAGLQQNVGDGLWRAVPGEGFAYVNTSFARMFGYGSAEELLSGWRRGAPDPHRESLAALAGDATPAHNRELRLTRRDGSEFWALVSRSVSTGADGEGVVCDGTISDITAHRELQDQLRHAQKMKAVGQLAGGVAHDFNNLLTAIQGFGESVRDELPDDSPLRKDVAQILDAARRAAELTRQLLAFGRRQVLSPRVLDLSDVVDELGDLLRRLTGARVDLRVERPADPVRVRVDRGQLEQVLVNLVINSRDAMPDGGRITITTSTTEVVGDDPRRRTELPAGRYALLSVRDDGCGMSPDVQARAFEPFFTTKGHGRGTGLGLSTVYGIVTQSGGAVEIDSAPGRGTTVSVLLPFEHAQPAAAEPLLLPRPRAGAATVLVVEDEPFVLQLAARALRRAGHEVLCARDGTQALELFAARPGDVDAVVTDLVMPELSGRDLAERLLAARPSLGVVFMSGYAEGDLGRVTGDGRRTRFLAKPFAAAELVAEVDAVLTAAPAGPAAPAPAPTEI